MDDIPSQGDFKDVTNAHGFCFLLHFKEDMLVIAGVFCYMLSLLRARCQWRQEKSVTEACNGSLLCSLLIAFGILHPR